MFIYITLTASRGSCLEYTHYFASACLTSIIIMLVCPIILMFSGKLLGMSEWCWRRRYGCKILGSCPHLHASFALFKHKSCVNSPDDDDRRTITRRIIYHHHYYRQSFSCLEEIIKILCKLLLLTLFTEQLLFLPLFHPHESLSLLAARVDCLFMYVIYFKWQQIIM